MAKSPKAVLTAISRDALQFIPLDELEDFQGDLKRLSDESYESLKALILKLKFSFVIHVWKNKGKYFILDGHQRVATCKRMRDEEEYKIPDLPVITVEAKSLQEAKHKVLASVSQFGEVKADGLHHFLEESKLNVDDVLKNVRLPEINLERFALTYYPVALDTPPAPADESPKIQVEAHERRKDAGDNEASEDTDDDRCCPKCGYSW